MAQTFQLSAAAVSRIVTRPSAFLGLYNRLGGGSPAAYIQSLLGAPFATLADAGCQATFASIVAYNTAPVGTPTLDPMGATLHQLLTSPVLACGHFCKLAALLTLIGNPELMPPDAAPADPPKATVHFLVWLESTPLNVGVHSQLLITNVLDDAYLLLDPMYAFALRIPYVGTPQAGLTQIENAAYMMQTPIAQDNLVVFDAAASAAAPQVLQTMVSGSMGLDYIYHDALYGSEGWDGVIAQTSDTLGVSATAL